MKTVNKVYEPVSRLPVAKFYYRGNHSHPVRRTVLVVEETKEQIRGYELREGNVSRTISEVGKKIKSYRKDRIARWNDYSRLKAAAKAKRKNVTSTTLERFPIAAMFVD